MGIALQRQAGQVSRPAQTVDHVIDQLIDHGGGGFDGQRLEIRVQFGMMGQPLIGPAGSPDPLSLFWELQRRASERQGPW